MPYVIAATAFASVGLLSWALLSALFSNERRVAKRLAGLNAYETTQATVAHPQLKPLSQRVIAPGAARIRGAMVGLAPQGFRERATHELQLAGSPGGLDAGRLFTIKVLLAVCAGALAVSWAVLVGGTTLTWLAALALTLAAYLAPDLWLAQRVSARKKAILLSLPDMLDMLTISIEAGLGFDQAIAKIVRTGDGPLHWELARALRDIQAGADRSDALRALANRTDVSELNAFITAIVQAEQLGIPIGRVLRTQASEMRLTRRQRAEERAQKTPVKIVFPLILCILPATMIVILGPAVVSIGQAFGAW